MNLFITGATGFIGTNLIDFFLKKNINLTINIRKKNQITFNQSINTYSLQQGSIEDDINFFKKNKFDGVIHLASLYLKSHKPSDLNNLMGSNIGFSMHVLECAVQSNVKWFINTGSFFQNKNKKNYSPVNLYSATKEAFMTMAKYYYENEMINFYTIKIPDTYGPNDTRPKLINILLKSIYSNKQISMQGNPNQLLNLVHVNDVVNAFYLLSRQLLNNSNSFENGYTFSLDSFEKYTLNEIVDIINLCSNKRLNISWENSSDILSITGPKNIDKVPNWKQKISFKNGILEML